MPCRSAQICLRDSYCFLWTTIPLIFDGERVLEAWGFPYFSQWHLEKRGPGLGNYWRNGHESLLLGKRGILRRLPRPCAAKATRSPRGRP